MAEQEWETIAYNLLEAEKSANKHVTPTPTQVLVTWNDKIYFGHIQELVPKYSREIVLLSKTSNPIPCGLVHAINRLNPERLNLTADSSLDLIGRQHILRRLENKLGITTPEQTDYMVNHIPLIYEQNS